jgi:predicted metal-binding membrane protein
MRSRSAPTLLAGLAGFTLLAWIATARLMGGMDAGPGTPLGSFAGFVVTWAVMMTAMMLPAEMRFTLAFARFARDEHAGEPAPDGDRRRIAAFLGGYLLSWTTFGVLAWIADRALRALAPSALAWDSHGPLAAGAVIVLAGAYQLSPWKQTCLQHCVSPLAFFLQHWRDGLGGAARMGITHGWYCIGCCWALMVMLFALGIMSLYWMSLLAVLMFAEKVLPVGPRFARVLATGLVGLGLWVAIAPGSVPGLTLPGDAVVHRAH